MTEGVIEQKDKDRCKEKSEGMSMQLLGDITGGQIDQILRMPKAPTAPASWSQDLQYYCTLAMTRAVPCAPGFKGFRAMAGIELEPAQIISLWFQDITALHIGIESLGEPLSEGEAGLIRDMAVRGYLQSVFAIWLAKSCGIYMRISEANRGFTRIETASEGQPGFGAAADILARLAVLFAEKTKQNPCDEMADTITDALETLAMIERASFTAYTERERATRASGFIVIPVAADGTGGGDGYDGDGEGFLLDAKAAYIVRGLATNYLLQGVKGFGGTRPLDDRLGVNLEKLKRRGDMKKAVADSVARISLIFDIMPLMAQARGLIARKG